MAVFPDLAERMAGLSVEDRLLLTLWYFAPGIPIPEIATVVGCTLDELCRRRKEVVIELLQDELTRNQHQPKTRRSRVHEDA